MWTYSAIISVIHLNIISFSFLFNLSILWICITDSVYIDIFDAKQACEHLTGFNVGGRYLTVLYYQPQKSSKIDTEQETKEINLLKKTVETNEELIKQEQGTTGNTNTAQDDNISLDLEDDERERNYRNKRR